MPHHGEVATKAMQILVKHQPASQIPASTLQRFSLLITMDTARRLDMYPPMLLLNVADVIGIPVIVAARP